MVIHSSVLNLPNSNIHHGLMVRNWASHGVGLCISLNIVVSFKLFYLQIMPCFDFSQSNLGLIKMIQYNPGNIHILRSVSSDV